MLRAPGHGRIDASGPNFVSMPGYTEIFTGHAPTCQDNDCGRPDQATFLEVLASRGAKVVMFASWEKVGNAVAHATSAFFVSAGRAEGDVQNPFPGGARTGPTRARSNSRSPVWLAAMGPRIATHGLVAARDHHLSDLAGTIVAVAMNEDVESGDLSELIAH